MVKLCIIWHHLLQEQDWTRFFWSELIKGDVILFFIVNMAYGHYSLHKAPVPVGFIKILLRIKKQIQAKYTETLVKISGKYIVPFPSFLGETDEHL